MEVKFKIFRGTFSSWDKLLQKAADFASFVGKDRLVNIAQSEDSEESVIVVWYWSE